MNSLTEKQTAFPCSHLQSQYTKNYLKSSLGRRKKSLGRRKWPLMLLVSLSSWVPDSMFSWQLTLSFFSWGSCIMINNSKNICKIIQNYHYCCWLFYVLTEINKLKEFLLQITRVETTSKIQSMQIRKLTKNLNNIFMPTNSEKISNFGT